MMTAGRNITLLLFIGTLLAACSPTREVVRPASSDIFPGKNYVFVRNELYLKLPMHGDTLVCKAVYQNSRAAEGRRIPVSANDAQALDLDMTEAIHIVLMDNSKVIEHGDTLLIPMQALDLVRTQEVNPGFVAGAVVGSVIGIGAVVIIVLVISAMAALIAALGSLLR